MTESNLSNNENQNNVANVKNLNAMEVISEAWALTSGNKSTIVLMCLATFAILTILTFILGKIFSLDTDSGKGIIGSLIGMIPFIVSAPLYGGISMAGILIARGDSSEVNFSLLTRYLPQMGSLALVAFLYNLATTIGFLFLILPGIYLSVTLIFAWPLVIDKKQKPVEALLFSLRETNRNFLQVFLAMIACFFINLIGALLLGVGLIWTIPMTTIANGLLYEKIFNTGN
jgi:hypothetical protein